MTSELERAPQDCLPVLPEAGTLPANPSYEQLRELERAMLEQGEPAETAIEHHFANGVYGREMFMPAGTMLTGKIHRHSTLNVLIQGDITVSTPEGIRRLQAPAVFVSAPGAKKVGFAHTDVRWLNVHPTKLTDLAAIEAKFIVLEAPHKIEEMRECLGSQ